MEELKLKSYNYTGVRWMKLRHLISTVQEINHKSEIVSTDVLVTEHENMCEFCIAVYMSDKYIQFNVMQHGMEVLRFLNVRKDKLTDILLEHGTITKSDIENIEIPLYGHAELRNICDQIHYYNRKITVPAGFFDVPDAVSKPVKLTKLGSFTDTAKVGTLILTQTGARCRFYTPDIKLPAKVYYKVFIPIDIKYALMIHNYLLDHHNWNLDTVNDICINVPHGSAEEVFYDRVSQWTAIMALNDKNEALKRQVLHKFYNLERKEDELLYKPDPDSFF